LLWPLYRIPAHDAPRDLAHFAVGVSTTRLERLLCQ
jgi:hypothetical protein